MKKVALFGHGVVGGGVVEILLDRGTELGLELVGICTKESKSNFSRSDLFCTADEIFDNPEVEIVFEAIGGCGAAFDFVKRSLSAGKSVVTANKEMVAKHFLELQKLAAEHGVFFLFEAAVGAGIPIIAALRAGMGGEHISEIVGILNGTTNYILTEIERTGANFSEVLAEAQRLGYAEADPTADVEGWDALYKLIILSALSFGKLFSPAEVLRMGISRIMPIDFEYARKFGGKIKLAGLARQDKDGVFAEVSPMMFSENSRIAKTDGVLNAIEIRGKYNTIGNFLSGEGAGRFPTACAMVSDALVIAYGRPILVENPVPAHPAESHEEPFFVRFLITDCPGILGEIGTIFGRHNVSIDAVSQLPHQTGERIHFALTTFSASRSNFSAAIQEISACDFNAEPPFFFPIVEKREIPNV